MLRNDFDPLDALGIATDRPTPYWGWGTIPDQYGRLWRDDDGEADPLTLPAELDGIGCHPNRLIAISEHESTIVLTAEPAESDDPEF